MRVARPVFRCSRSALALALLTLSACQGSQPAAPPAPAAPPTVGVLTLEPRPATVNIEHVGKLEAEKIVEIYPRVSGLLEKQVAVEGSRVKKGQLLFVLDKRPFAAALAAASAALEQTRAALQRAERDLARIEQLSKADAVSQQALDTMRSTQAESRAAMESAEANLQTARLNLQYAEIRSPIDGTLGRVEIRGGGLLTAYQSRLSTVYSTDPMYVNFSISERQLLELQRRFGSIALDHPRDAIFGIELSDGSKYPLQAALNFVAPAVDEQTGTLALRLTVDNPQQQLLSGQFVRVVVPTEQISDALVVPQRAVQERQGETFVFVLDASNQIESREVTMGARVGGDWLVQTGLQPGERVVVDGVQKVRPGTRVNPEPRKAAQAQPSGPAKG